MMPKIKKKPEQPKKPKLAKSTSQSVLVSKIADTTLPDITPSK